MPQQNDNDGISGDGKYLLISVPDFAQDTVGDKAGQPMTSFIRLGVFNDNWKSQPGADLAELAFKFTNSQGGHLNSQYGGEIAGTADGEAVDEAKVFLDDQRIRDGSTGTIPVADRLKQSKVLYTRGGWWDHSDGNRVSTTRGDKVEIIRGNYKMLVLGRQEMDDDLVPAGWDASGGHVQDTGHSMPGASVRVEYRQDKHGDGAGAWHLENTTNNFIQTSDFAGDFFEHWYGNKKECTIGSDSPKPWDAAKEKPLGNPHLLEKTWAESIKSYTGSSAWRIPEMYEETWAVRTTSKTNVSVSIDEETRCAGDITEKTFCGATLKSTTGSADERVPSIVEETWAEETSTTTEVSGTITEDTTCGVQISTTKAGAIVDVTLAGAQEEVTIVGHHGSLEVAANVTELFIGTKVSVDIGAQLGITLGVKKEIELPEREEVEIKRLKAALRNTETMLESQIFALEEKHACLQLQLQGLAVFLGL